MRLLHGPVFDDETTPSRDTYGMKNTMQRRKSHAGVGGERGPGDNRGKSVLHGPGKRGVRAHGKTHGSAT